MRAVGQFLVGDHEVVVNGGGATAEPNLLLLLFILPVIRRDIIGVVVGEACGEGEVRRSIRRVQNGSRSTLRRREATVATTLILLDPLQQGKIIQP